MWAASPLPIHQRFSNPNPSITDLCFHFKNPNPSITDLCFHFKNPNSSRRRSSVSTRCCAKKPKESKNHYELLGVSVDASGQEIKDAYRRLQKKYHPDIAGEKGHESAIMLNKAYEVLARDELREEYDKSIGRIRLAVETKTPGSIWKEPLRPQALFVDEHACVGCWKCVHYAGDTFTMDETCGTARVKVQYGDHGTKIEMAVESCPVSCIHWVDTEELEVLEFLIQPQPKKGYGIYGQGWERPKNVFMAAKSFNKQLDQQEESQQRKGKSRDKEETPAQAEARKNAYKELQMGSFARIWSWIKGSTSQ